MLNMIYNINSNVVYYKQSFSANKTQDYVDINVSLRIHIIGLYNKYHKKTLLASFLTVACRGHIAIRRN